MPCEFKVFDEIGWGELTAQGFGEFLDRCKDEEIRLLINSTGGNVFEGIAMQNLLAAYEGKSVARIVGVALSMASGLAVVADETEMADNALMMIHSPSVGAVGTADDMEKAKAMLQRANDSLVMAYVKKTGKTPEDISEMMRVETWLNAEEALDQGFVDRIVEPSEVVNKFALPATVRVPLGYLPTLSNFLKTESSPSNSTKEPEPMPNNTPDNEPQVATLDQLLNLAGADNDFAIDALKNQLTVEQAQNKLNERLVKQLQTEREAKEAAEQEIKDVKAKAETAKAATGHEPIGSGGKSEEQNDDEEDPHVTFKRVFAEACKRHTDSVKAYQDVCDNHPGLIDRVRTPAEA